MKVFINGLLTVLLISFTAFSCKEKITRNTTNDQKLGRKTAPDTVWMTGLKFEPEIIEVNKGDTIVWINKDIVAHNVTVLPNQEWTSGNIETDAIWKMAVKDGFNYFCTIHPPMKGEVKVK